MLVEGKILDTLFDNQEKEGFSENRSTGRDLVSGIIGLVLMVCAGYLAWTCNEGQGEVLRIVYTVLAVIFSGIYLLFYLIYHVILNNRCK